jgi:hypothetical protein
LYICRKYITLIFINMPFQKGHKKLSTRKGSPNKKTLQWEAFCEYAMSGGVEKFKKELATLTGARYTQTFLTLLEFLKPKLQRTEQSHSGEVNIKYSDIDIAQLNEQTIKQLTDIFCQANIKTSSEG